MEQHTVILVTGPTASGKTSVAISLAEKLRTEIISADSRQCFKELNIGVARPSLTELQQVKHHFIASHSIHDTVNAATFEKFATETCETLFRHHSTVVMTGGTGMYIRAFFNGLDQIPQVPEAIRENIIASYNEKGLSWLQQQVTSHDPRFMESGESRNPQRLMRALEVKLATGLSIKDHHTSKRRSQPFHTIKLGIDISKQQLHDHINARVDTMMASGLLDEVISLMPYRHLNALQTVGYKELFDHLDGILSLPQAVEKIKMNTRQYAKRQMTWFRKEDDIKWMPVSSLVDYALSVRI